jgi:hypothetical protein
VCLSALALTACIGGSESSHLSATGKTCRAAVDKAITGMGDQYTGGDFIRIGAGGNALSVSSPVAGEDGAIVAAVAIGCILQRTKAPNSVQAELQQVTPRDGRQEVTWSDLSMSYVLDPRNGLSAVVTAD